MTNTLPEHLRTILFNRVPEITVAFWVIKVLSTTVGETFADYLNVDVGLGLTITTYIMGGLLILALIAQFATKRYTSGIYWTAVVLISVVGTLLTDNLTDVLGVELWVSTVVISILALSLVAMSDGTVVIDNRPGIGLTVTVSLPLSPAQE